MLLGSGKGASENEEQAIPADRCQRASGSGRQQATGHPV